ncbi:dipeptide ABC transporter ATP-binding protein [Sphingosinicella sp.]|uniref:dipeptide ABC transporter ATP-binding protein n=1 Tax=Sphingosinicella sp. TaxID=1917971 RepID=UPI0035B0DD64
MSIDTPTPVLDVNGLTIALSRHGRVVRKLVENVSFTIPSKGILALVGESGSGKTMIGRSILGLLPDAASIAAGNVDLAGESLIGLPPQRMRHIRGSRIGMVFQEPMVSLNPSLRIGFQMMEALRLHKRMSVSEARELCLDMLARVGIVDPQGSFDAYPAQFSGGMRQRIMLASVLAIRPTLLIADEPTTALDAVIRKQVMDLMVDLTQEMSTAVLLISHDLGMVSQYADQVVVMQHGQMIEAGSPDDILLNPQHDYTAALVGALPSRLPDDNSKSAKAPLIEIRDLRIEYPRKRRLFRKSPPTRPAVDAVSFDICRGETLAVVGESGSGKTTIGRALIRLLEKTSGQVRFDGDDYDQFSAERLRWFRQSTQMVFQDPYGSLDPRMRLEELVAESLRLQRSLPTQQRLERARAMLTEVGLPGEFARRFAHELSGGQRQRVCIARAIVGEPKFIVADEPVSALDVTIQSQVLALLSRLQKKYSFTVMFISHDLGVVEQIADRVAVMFRGYLVEIGSRDDIYDRPHHPYTQKLLAATPRLYRRDEGGYALMTPDLRKMRTPDNLDWFSPSDMPHQMRMMEVGQGHWVACRPSLT